MDITFSASSAGVFSRILISIHGEPERCELSAIIVSPSGREEIYLPSPDRLASGVTYPHSGGRFVTCIGKGRYQLIYQPMEKGNHTLKVFGRILERRRLGNEAGDKSRLLDSNRFGKEFQLTF
jgi:hypothetical protein